MSERGGGGLLGYRVGLSLLAGMLPRAERREWVREWMAELWSVRASLPDGMDAVARQRAMAAFAWGAVADGWGLRQMRQVARRPAERAEAETAGRCLAGLATLLAAVVLVGVSLPGVRGAVRRVVSRTEPGVVLITPANGGLVEAGTVRSWQGRRQRLFREFGAFAVGTETVRVGRAEGRMPVARGTDNLMGLLGGRVEHEVEEDPGERLPQMLLSRSAWERCFGGRTEVLGRTAWVGRTRVWLAGTVADEIDPTGGESTGGEVDGWLLLGPAGLPDGTGVVAVGRLAETAEMRGAAVWPMEVRGADGVAEFRCESLAAAGEPVGSRFVFALLLAVLSLPASLFSTANEGSICAAEVARGARWRRLAFLGAKLTMLLPVVFGLAVGAAYGVRWGGAETAGYLELAVGFAGGLAALHWTVRDQRQRCPVCLGRLRCPARVGQPSRNFLTWNGTELMCAGGHGLLHVPELPTSWFYRPRWLALDASWRGLFAPTA